MVNRIFPSRPGPPRSTPAAEETTSAAPPAQSASPVPGEARQGKSGVLARLGFLPPTGRTELSPVQFSYPAASLMPSRASQAPVTHGQPAATQVGAAGPAKQLEETIRAALPTLSAAEASRYQRLLDNTLRASDPARGALLKMLEANVRSAVARQSAAPPQATVWQSFAKTSVNVQFQGNVESMSRAREEQLLRLQEDIRKLPADIATGYQSLLRDILATSGAAKRDAMLTRMARQVAARSDAGPEA